MPYSYLTSYMLILFDIEFCIHWCWSDMSLICRNCRRFLWDLEYFPDPIWGGLFEAHSSALHRYTNKYEQTRNVFKQGTLYNLVEPECSAKCTERFGYKWYIAKWMFHMLPPIKRTSIIEFTRKGHLVLFSDRWLCLKILKLHWQILCSQWEILELFCRL